MACRRSLTLCVAALIVAHSRSVSAQAGSADVAKRVLSNDSSLLKLDLSLPDVPAAILIDVDPSKAGTPGNPRALAMAFSGFGGAKGDFHLPNTFAVEFAPRLLFFGRGLSAASYRANVPLSTFRISAATSRIDDSTGASRFGIGVRTNFVDHSDPRATRSYQRLLKVHVDSLADLQHEIVVAALARNAPTATATEKDSLGKVIDALNRHKDVITKRLDSIRTNYIDNAWRALRVELAYALGARSQDSSGTKPHSDAHAAWLGFSMPLFPHTAGIIVARYQNIRDTSQTNSPFVQAGGGAARLLFGNNRAKLFAEGSGFSSRGHRWQRALVAGGEVHVATDLWFRLSAGVETPAEGGKTRFVSTFKINAAPATSDAAESKQK